MGSEPSDTFTWLLTRAEACPACGAGLSPAAPGCNACGRSLLVRYRPPQRSNTAKALAGAWLLGGMGALLALIGTLAQVLGITEQTNSDLVLRTLLIGSTLAGLLCAAMTWACLQRRPGALYVGELDPMSAEDLADIAALPVKDVRPGMAAFVRM